MERLVVAAILEEQFPQLAPVSVALLGEGCDSLAFEVNATWVFRFPKSEVVEEQLFIETLMLPALSTRLPVAVPGFCFHGRPSRRFPRRFAGYRKLPGARAIEAVPQSDATLAPALGRFLSALHAFPVDEAKAAGVPEQDIRSVVNELQEEALEDFDLVAQVAPAAPLKDWRQFFAAGVDDRVRGVRTVHALVHNDLAAEHVLVDPAAQSITGIIDWSDIALSDRAADFAGLFHWGGPAFVDRVLSHYDGSLDALARQRARFMAACRGVGDVRFGLERNRTEYVAAGLRALTLCAI